MTNYLAKLLSSECVKPLIEKYGFNRILWVLASTLKEQAYDGRYSQDNKNWSDIFFIPKEKARKDYSIKNHPAVVDGFINQVREE